MSPYDTSNVKRTIDALPSQFSLTRYVLVVIEAMRGKKVPIAFDDKQIADFIAFCAQVWNETRSEADFIGFDELTDLIEDQLDFEQKQHDRMSAVPT